MIDVLPTSLSDARAASVLLGESGTSDVVDALVALAVMPGDQLLTSDPDDLGSLTARRGLPVTIIRV